jgi:hypothetical protein
MDGWMDGWKEGRGNEDENKEEEPSRMESNPWMELASNLNSFNQWMNFIC